MIKVSQGNIDCEVKSFVFSGGEVSVSLPDKLDYKSPVQITAHLKASDDIMKLLMLNDAIKRHSTDIKVSLVMPYVPYARQDRVCNQGEALSIKVFCDLINSCNFESVVVYDPHSDVAPALLDNVCIISQVSLASAYLRKELKGLNLSDVLICAPDGGALKKAFGLGQVLGCEVIAAEKVRNLSDGKILSTKVHCGDLTGKVVWMVDDIADGAMTFIKLAEALYNEGAKEVNLWVTHGIFSKGKEVLYNVGVKKVISARDWSDN